jgi:hypothetical protein
MLSFFRLLFTGAFLTGALQLMAQSSADKKFVPDIKRQLFHGYIDREQRNILLSDGKSDGDFFATKDENINYLVTRAVTQRVDTLQYKIERDTVAAHNYKVAYLRGIENLLKKFLAGYKKQEIPASYLPLALDTYEKAIEADKSKKSIDSLIINAPYQVGNLIVGSGAFDGNAGVKVARYALMRKYANLHPEGTFIMLKENPDVPFRDSLIKIAAYKYPRILYDYAAANNRLGWAIRQIDDPLVKTVSKMAQSRGGQFYFAFLDNILKGRQTMGSIDSVKDDNVKFYRLLVKTRLDYVQRIQNKEQVWEVKALTDMLEKKAKDVFIKTINALHEESDAVRFRILYQLTPQELYYLAVFGEDEIYTSSYTKGVYPVMMQKIGNRGDSLMVSVSFDRFKKFIKMAAGFNTLNSFLKTFPNHEQSKSLMTAFVNGLEKSEGLEDGVDVADSYISIYEGNKDLAKYMLDLTKWNYDKNMGQSKRGTIMYNLLYKLFLSADTTNNVNLTQEFGIPPVYNVNYRELADTGQRVVMQVFFYGDEDGQNAYNGFLRQFSSSNWRISYADKWVVISSLKGKAVWIFANKPFPGEDGGDEKAQDALNEYLAGRGLEPSIVIHRGHSYYAPYTIKQIQSSAKIVFLGSCGGYHLIHSVLEHAPDAHIIASKQIGKTVINQPFFNLLMEKMRNGNNVDWIPFWHEFGRMVTDKEGFQDYIPPHKNLGAIFIKAYKIQMGEDEREE